MPMMKRDYEIVMNTVRKAHDETYNEWPMTAHNAVAKLAKKLAEAFKAENSRFDEGRFLRGCGIKAAKTIPISDFGGTNGAHAILLSEEPEPTLDRSKAKSCIGADTVMIWPDGVMAFMWEIQSGEYNYKSDDYRPATKREAAEYTGSF